MTGPDDGLYAALLERGITRRAFLKFSTAMAAALALPASYAPQIATAVASAPRIPVIWLRGQDCTGNTMAFLRAAHPPVTELVLELLSIEYHETIMAPAGAAAALSLTDTMDRYPGEYIAVVEGAIPTADEGVHCTIGGRAFRDVVREVCDGALATIAVGACAFDGGAPAAGGGPTGAVGVADIVSGGQLISLPGCPLNVENLTATIVHYVTFKEWPPTDAMHRPYFAYGALIHNQCERRPHYEFGEYVVAWGDEGAQKGWCLYKMGCKGPETFANCPTVQYADGTSWPVRAGHGCVGCHMPGFWDAMSPFYRRLPAPLPFAPQVTTDHLGQVLVGAVIAGTAVHGAASYVRHRRGHPTEGHEPPPAEVEVDVEGQTPSSEPGAAGRAGPMAIALEPEPGEAPSPEPTEPLEAEHAEVEGGAFVPGGPEAAVVEPEPAGPPATEPAGPPATEPGEQDEPGDPTAPEVDR